MRTIGIISGPGLEFSQRLRTVFNSSILNSALIAPSFGCSSFLGDRSTALDSGLVFLFFYFANVGL